MAEASITFRVRWPMLFVLLTKLGMDRLAARLIVVET